MPAKMHYRLAGGKVHGLYGCGFRWWTRNPGNDAGGLGRRFVWMRFQGINNTASCTVSLDGPQVHTALLGEDGYLRNVWRNGLADAMEPAAVALDVDEAYLCRLGQESLMERFRAGWTPCGSVAQAVDGLAETERQEHDSLVEQLAWASSHALGRQEDLKTFLVRNRCETRYDDGDAPANATAIATAALLLFKPWQWASLHATLYSLCAPFTAGAPG